MERTSRTIVYGPHGRKLLDELGELGDTAHAPVYFRVHNLFTSGDGEGSLKWGSTNVYTERADGTPVYDWTITDRIFDAMRDAHVRPIVELGFMPEALSTHPRAVPSQLSERRCLHRLELPAEGLREVGLAGRSLCRTPEGSLRNASGRLALGGMERAGYRLLARHTAGVRPALRCLGCGGAQGTAASEDRRPGLDGRLCGKGWAKRERGISAAISGALRPWKKCGDWPDGRAARLHQLSSQGFAEVCGRPCSDERRASACRGGARHGCGGELSGVAQHAYSAGRERSGGMRRLSGAAERLSQRPALRGERGGGDGAHLGAGTQT